MSGGGIHLSGLHLPHHFVHPKACQNVQGILQGGGCIELRSDVHKFLNGEQPKVLLVDTSSWQVSCGQRGCSWGYYQSKNFCVEGIWWGDGEGLLLASRKSLQTDYTGHAVLTLLCCAAVNLDRECIRMVEGVLKIISLEALQVQCTL